MKKFVNKLIKNISKIFIILAVPTVHVYPYEHNKGYKHNKGRDLKGKTRISVNTGTKNA